MEVSSPAHVLQIIHQGANNRAVGETKTNQRSSRSHCLVTVLVDGRRQLDGATTHACLCLVDLAGSERVAKSEAEGTGKREFGGLVCLRVARRTLATACRGLWTCRMGI